MTSALAVAHAGAGAHLQPGDVLHALFERALDVATGDLFAAADHRIGPRQFDLAGAALV